MIKKFLALFVFVLTISSCSSPSLKPVSEITQGHTSTPFFSQTKTPTMTVSLTPEPLIFTPISSPFDRVTKKPFGINISPSDSPVKPERFTGYHTGVDFEIFPNEENIDVPIYAICSGKLLLKETASGYGGVISEACFINNQDMTVVYGHLKLSSIKKEIGQEFRKGEQIGVLGQGFSKETDGERKHLHLAIHKGKEVFLRGYLGSSSGLSDWIDVMKILKG